jgi:hypothetical protein
MCLSDFAAAHRATSKRYARGTPAKEASSRKRNRALIRAAGRLCSDGKGYVAILDTEAFRTTASLLSAGVALKRLIVVERDARTASAMKAVVPSVRVRATTAAEFVASFRNKIDIFYLDGFSTPSGNRWCRPLEVVGDLFRRGLMSAGSVLAVTISCRERDAVSRFAIGVNLAAASIGISVSDSYEPAATGRGMYLCVFTVGGALRVRSQTIPVESAISSSSSSSSDSEYEYEDDMVRIDVSGDAYPGEGVASMPECEEIRRLPPGTRILIRCAFDGDPELAWCSGRVRRPRAGRASIYVIDWSCGGRSTVRVLDATRYVSTIEEGEASEGSWCVLTRVGRPNDSSIERKIE